MIEKRRTLDSLKATGPYWHIHVRYVTQCYEDGVAITGKAYDRYVIDPGQDVSGEDPRIQAFAQATHTPDVVNSHRSLTAQQRARNGQ